MRPLVYGDLPAVLAIERRSFQTPWSLAMFVLELSKPSGICLAIVGEQRAGRLPGLLALRRRLAPDEHRRDPRAPARGDRDRMLMERLFDAAGAEARFTLEVRTSNRARDRDVRALRLPARRPPPPLLPRQRRGRPDHVARAGAGRRLSAGVRARARRDPRRSRRPATTPARRSSTARRSAPT